MAEDSEKWWMEWYFVKSTIIYDYSIWTLHELRGLYSFTYLDWDLAYAEIIRSPDAIYVDHSLHYSEKSLECKNINGIFACACLKFKDIFIKIYGFQKDIIKLVWSCHLEQNPSHFLK